MKTREKAIIGMIAGLTAVSILIGGCYTDETPESSSFSSDLIQDTDNTSESLLESDASVLSEATESSSLISQTETSVTEKDTEESNKNTAGNEKTIFIIHAGFIVARWPHGTNSKRKLPFLYTSLAN